MAILRIHLSDFDQQVLNSMVENTGRSKKALVIEAIRNLNLELKEESEVTRLSGDVFDAFLDKVSGQETDPQVWAAREKLLNFESVWAK